MEATNYYYAIVSCYTRLKAVFLSIVGMLPGSLSESLITLYPMENKKTALIITGGLIIGLFIGYLIATNVIANR